MFRTLTSPLGYCLVAIAMLFFSGNAVAKDLSAACEASMDRTVGRYSECLLNADAHYARQGSTTRLEKRQARCEARFERRAARAIARYGADHCPSSDLVTAMAERTENFAGNIALEAGGGQATGLIFVHSAEGMELYEDSLVLTGVANRTAWISNHPTRKAGQESTSHFVDRWNLGDPNHFASEPPKAALTCESEEGTVSQALKLQNPELSQGGDSLFYEVTPVGEDAGADQEVKACAGPAHLFIEGGTGPCNDNKVCNAINAVFYSTNYTTLARAGVSLHEWDKTEYLPQPWIQQEEQGHEATTASAGIVNNEGRTSNLPSGPQGPDGVISVFVIGYQNLPNLGGVIYNTAATDASGSPLVSLTCGYGADAGDDTRRTGCGCPKPAKTACQGFDPATDHCPTGPQPEGPWKDCANQCHNCTNICSDQDGQLNNPNCAYMPGTNMIKYIMDTNAFECELAFKAGLGAGCYNEILVDTTQWSPEDFPNLVQAFSYAKEYGDQKSPAWGVEGSPCPEGCVWQGYTTRAWYNFLSMYPSANPAPPLLEMDVLVSKSQSTPPFSLVCANLKDRSDICTAALTLAGIKDADRTPNGKIFCPSDSFTGKIAKDPKGGLTAVCTCKEGHVSPDDPNICTN